MVKLPHLVPHLESGLEPCRAAPRGLREKATGAATVTPHVAVPCRTNFVIRCGSRLIDWNQHQNGRRYEVKRQTEAERKAIKIRELDRVSVTLAHQQRTGKRRSIPWIIIDLETGEVEPPRNVLRVVK
jgi:hypothetical protein